MGTTIGLFVCFKQTSHIWSLTFSVTYLFYSTLSGSSSTFDVICKSMILFSGITDCSRLLPKLILLLADTGRSSGCMIIVVQVNNEILSRNYRSIVVSLANSYIASSHHHWPLLFKANVANELCTYTTGPVEQTRRSNCPSGERSPLQVDERAPSSM